MDYSKQNRPDYESYSLDELRDAQRHIDKDQYPERAAEIERQIQIRINSPPVGKEKQLSPPLPFELTKRGLGFVMAGIGGYSLADILDADRSGSVMLFYALASCFYGGMMAAGLLLVARKRIGVWLGFVVMFLQVPIIRVARIEYSISAVPALDLKLWPRIGFGANASGHMSVNWYFENQPLYLGANLLAFAAAGVFASYLIRQISAYHRLRNR